MDLTMLIDTIWKVLDYFIEHKKQMPRGDDYSKLSRLELHTIRQRLYQSRAKRKRTLAKWKSSLKSTHKTKRLALQSKIDKQVNIIAKLDANIEKLSEIINTNQK